MAKKKVSHSHLEKPQQTQEVFLKPHSAVAPTMDSEATEKLESLKSLNQMLLKEAFERRQEVDSLLLSRGTLEFELARSESEKEELKSELTQLGERSAMLELERSVLAVFAAVQLGQKGEMAEREMKGLETEVIVLKKIINEKESEDAILNEKLGEVEDELGNEKEISKRVSAERDNLKDELHLQIEGGKIMKAGLIQLEEKKMEVEGEIRELQAAYDFVLGEKEKGERRIESIVREKDLIERSLANSNKSIEEIKEQLDGVVREKERIEREKKMEMIKRSELENDLRGLNEMVASLREEEEKLLANVSDLENESVEGEEREKEMLKEIDRLVEERKLIENRVEELTNEKDMVKKDLGVSLKQVDRQRLCIEEMVSEKMVLLEDKVRLNAEVVALQSQVNELNTVVGKLEESGAVKLMRIKSLESEVGDYSSKLEQVEVERDEYIKISNEQKENAVRLMEKIEEMEKKIEENAKAIGEAEAKNAAVIAEKMELESQYEMLQKEIMSLKNTLNEAKNKFGSLQRKLELADANSELLLKMLLETATFCLKDANDASDGERQISGEETKDHMMELEKIKNAFKKKESKVESMTREMESLKNSVEEAHKKKSFWTALSSATTLLAAISVAYVARGH